MVRRRELPEWPDREAVRPRVLVEHEDDAVAYSIKAVLEERGCDVAICPGPNGLPRGRCPLAAGSVCALAAGADVAIHALNLNEPKNRSVLAALRVRCPGLPVVVEAPAQSLARYADDVRDCVVVPFPMTRRTLVAAFEDVTSR